jgi:hypothetical protein
MLKYLRSNTASYLIFIRICGRFAASDWEYSCIPFLAKVPTH